MSRPRFTLADGHALRRQLGGRAMASGLMCPACKGGRSGERSVTARVSGLSLQATCWRNKCGAWGKWGPDAIGVTHSQEAATRPAFDPSTLPLDDACQAALEARYRLPPWGAIALQGVRQSPGGASLWLPIRDPLGRHRGWVQRMLDGSKPKVRSYPGPDHRGAWMAWFPRSPAGRVIVVEDVLSALRLWDAGCNAVSLLGTSLSGDKVAELRRFSDEAVIALDADAVSRAIGYAIRHDFHVRRIDPDIKDMTQEQLSTWLQSLSSSLPPSVIVTPAS